MSRVSKGAQKRLVKQIAFDRWKEVNYTLWESDTVNEKNEQVWTRRPNYVTFRTKDWL